MKYRKMSRHFGNHMQKGPNIKIIIWYLKSGNGRFCCRNARWRVRTRSFYPLQLVLLFARTLGHREHKGWHGIFNSTIPILVFSVKVRSGVQARTASRATPIVASRGAPNEGICCFTMPICEGRETRSPRSETINFLMFQCSQQFSHKQICS